MSVFNFRYFLSVSLFFLSFFANVLKPSLSLSRSLSLSLSHTHTHTHTEPRELEMFDDVSGSINLERTKVFLAVMCVYGRVSPVPVVHPHEGEIAWQWFEMLITEAENQYSSFGNAVHVIIDFDKTAAPDQDTWVRLIFALLVRCLTLVVK